MHKRRRGPMDRLNVTLEAEDAARLRRLARENHLPVSAVVNKIVTDWLRRPVFFLDDLHTGSVQGAHGNTKGNGERVVA